MQSARSRTISKWPEELRPGDLVTWKMRYVPAAGKQYVGLFSEHPIHAQLSSKVVRVLINVWTVISVDDEENYVLVLASPGMGWTAMEFIEKV